MWCPAGAGACGLYGRSGEGQAGSGSELLRLGGDGGQGGGWQLLAGTAFTGDQDTDALDELGSGAGAFRKEGVGGAAPVEVGDGAGDNHGGERGAELLGAADKLVAIHAGHEEVAEKEVKGAGGGALDGLKRGVRGVRGEHAVAAGFEQKRSDGKAGFVVVDAKDRLFRAHVVSLLPRCVWRSAADGSFRYSANVQTWRS